VAVIQLSERRVEKPWGRRDLPEMFGGAAQGGEPVGEIWFEHPRGSEAELLVKYLFTSEKLSIQVHPDDAAARRSGQPRGKDEAWIVLGAEPDAVIGIGLREPVSAEALRAAALDGSIEGLIDWRPAAAGDVYYSPGGTIHSLGPGLTLIEIQQNVDLTYRLYDFGRPRELHLDEGIEAADPAPYSPPMMPYVRADGREILAQGGAFVLERWAGPRSERLGSRDGPLWLVPVEGRGEAEGNPLEPGTAWTVEGEARLTLEEGAALLVAYPGGAVREALTG
jgi:mannose-6-phosphate isomerase